jgi:hypothetical protein
MTLNPSTATTKWRGLTPLSQAWSISFGFHSRELLAISQVWLMRPVMPVPDPPEDGVGRAGGLAHVLLGQDLDEVDHGVGALDLDHLGPLRGGQAAQAEEGQGQEREELWSFHVLSPIGCLGIVLDERPPRQKDRKNVRLKTTSVFFVALAL